MSIITIDIETIPCQKSYIKDLKGKCISHPGNIKKQESIDKWNIESKPAAIAAAIDKTGLDGTHGEILCISFAMNDDEPECIGRKIGDPEKEFLSDASSMIGSAIGSSVPIWVGHNHVDFDMRFIFLRMVINGVKPEFFFPYNSKPWGERVFDTKYEWKGAASSPASASLNDICIALGIGGKGDIDGSKVYQAALDGRYDEIYEYCKDDVRKTRDVYKALNFLSYMEK